MHVSGQFVGNAHAFQPPAQFQFLTKIILLIAFPVLYRAQWLIDKDVKSTFSFNFLFIVVILPLHCVRKDC